MAYQFGCQCKFTELDTIYLVFFDINMTFWLVILFRLSFRFILIYVTFAENIESLRVFSIYDRNGVWCSWLACLHGVQVVAGSSPATPTVEIKACKSLQAFLFNDFYLISGLDTK